MASNWTAEQNKRFETALAVFDKDIPDRWEKVAAMVGGGKSAADVKQHYDVLLEDVASIEAGRIPLPMYRKPKPSRHTTADLQDDNYC